MMRIDSMTSRLDSKIMESGIGVLLCLLSVCSSSVGAIDDPLLPPGLFYPFGEDQGDAIVPINRTASSMFKLERPLIFHDTLLEFIYVNSMGIISFTDPLYIPFTPETLPLIGSEFAFIAPYWADVDTTLNNGRVYYRQITRDSADKELLERGTTDVRIGLGLATDLHTFQARWMFIATWHNVTFSQYGTPTSPTNTFQAVVLWDYDHSAVLYNYGNLTWTTGGPSGGSSDGLGGTPALVGYNSGTSRFYYQNTWSMTNAILRVASTSNAAQYKPGRWVYRIDSNSNNSICSESLAADDAPVFSRPVLKGPFLIDNNSSFAFYCSIMTTETNRDAQYEVSFQFDGESFNDVPPWTVSADRQNVTLPGKDIYGKLGKQLRCSVLSYWFDSPENCSAPLTSDAYFVGIEISPDNVEIDENALGHSAIFLKSTIPITCSDGQSAPLCTLSIQYEASAGDIALQQRYPDRSPLQHSCEYIIGSADWNATESRAYNAKSPLEIISRMDPYVTAPRVAMISFRADALTGSIWSGYVINSKITVKRYDNANALSLCSSVGDPHLVTFDNLYYSAYQTGTYIYVRSTSGIPFEVHVRQCPCLTASTYSCLCGIAVRENGTVFVADMCNEGRTISYRSLHSHDLTTQTTGIFTDVTKYSFKIQMQSGSRVYGSVDPNRHMNVWLALNGGIKVEGLCGSPDGDNSNDLKFRTNDTALPPDISNPSDPLIPEAIMTSWRLEANESLFDYFLADLHPNDNREGDLSTYCQCTKEGTVCGAAAVTDLNWPGDPILPVRQSDNLGCSSDLNPSDCGYIFDHSDRIEVLKEKRQRESQLITDEEANVTCWSVIMNEYYIGPFCLALLNANPSAAEQIVNKCITDIQLTGDVNWAGDKIPDAQRWCYFHSLATNHSDYSNVSEAIARANDDVKLVTDFVCSPFNCSGHGRCINGNCSCDAGYIGADCAVQNGVTPKVVRALCGSNCDLRSDECIAVKLDTLNVANEPTLRCRIIVHMVNGIYYEIRSPGVIISPTTVECNLTTVPLLYTSYHLNFTSLHGQGFNFSCLSQGSPVTKYNISLSNNGDDFGSSVEYTIFDSLCMTCSDQECTQKSMTCNINGYCFGNRELNPYLSECEQCIPETSNDSWSKLTDVPVADEKCQVWSNCRTDEWCVPERNFTYYCAYNPTTATFTETTFIVPDQSNTIHKKTLLHESLVLAMSIRVVLQKLNILR